MKKLLTLLIIWLGLTFWLACDSLKFKQFKEDNMEWRAFLVYTYTFAGCESGITYNIQRDMTPSLNNYEFCKELSFKTKSIYENAWKK